MNRRTIPSWILFTLAALAALWAKDALGQVGWHEFQPQGFVDGKGILEDVRSRCDEFGKKNGYDRDHVTCCHESTHQVNSRIRNSVGGTGKVNAFYVGKGLCFILPEPNVTLRQVSEFVSEHKNSTFDLYLVQQRQYWDHEPLYILDEFSAYVNGCQAAIELQVDEHGSNDRATWFCHYADALVAAVKRHDPQYAELPQLIEFVEFQQKRVAEITQPKRGQWLYGDLAELAPTFRHRNPDGSCVHLSTGHILHYMGLHREAEEWIDRHHGGESPSPHKSKLDRSGLKYVMTTDADDAFLEWCLDNRYMMGVTTKPMHCLNLLGRIERDGQWYAVLLDNNRPNELEYDPWDRWYRKYKNSGWAFTIISGEIPPPPPTGVVPLWPNQPLSQLCSHSR